MTSRRRCVTERRRLRRWRWLRQRRHFSRQRRRQRGCCSSQHPWRGHFSPILAEGRELQPPLQQFEFQFLQGLRTRCTEEEPKKFPLLPHSESASARQPVGRRPSLSQEPRGEARTAAARGGGSPLRGGLSRRFSPSPGAGFRQRQSACPWG